MFRGYMPALTLTIFAIGFGIGTSISRGWIPLAIEPVQTGSLGIEVVQREELPPPNDPYFAAARKKRIAEVDQSPDDPTIFDQQTEPTSDQTASNTDRPNRNRVIQNSQTGTTDEDSVNQTTDPNERTTTAIRLRSRTDVQHDRQSDFDDADSRPPQRKVTRVAHQDPSDSANDASSNTASPRELFASAQEKLAAGEILAAHRDLSKLYWNHKEFRPQLQEAIDRTTNAIFFESRNHYVQPYVIQDGDRLEAIAKKYQLSWEYLARLNRTNPKRIQVGQKLKVMKGPFGAVVDLKEFALTVHLQGYYVKRYAVGIGKDGASPIGKFTVLSKVENPQYTGPDGKVISSDDPSNPLGERWIDIGDSFGIHGTIDPSSIGKAESKGCIRMRDHDIIEVYDFLVKGSEVVIRR